LDKDMYCTDCPLCSRPRISEFHQRNPDILFVGAFPVDADIKAGPFKGKNSFLLRKLLDNLKSTGQVPLNIKVDYTYACRCSPAFNEETRKFEVNADIYAKCSMFLKKQVDDYKPKVIVGLGGDALKALGFKEQPKNMRGGIYHFRASHGIVPVVATFHIVAVNKSPGYLPTFEKDILKAALMAKDGMSDVSMDIRTPKTVEDILAQLDEVLSTADKSFAQTGSPMAVAVDTETTSLKPYAKEERVIMISMSHKRQEGLAYPFEHKQNPFTPEEFKQVYDKTVEVLSSPHISLVMANGKFDIQWLQYHYGMQIRPLAYDVILAEHVLDEDKKGEYSLKDLTRDRFPSMGKYEDELKQHLQDVWGAKDAKISELQEQHKEAVKRAIIDWWVGLSKEQRKEAYVPWVDRGYIGLEDISALSEVKYVKRKGEMVIPKKYQESLTKLIAQVPQHEVEQHVAFPVLEIPEELQIKTYEDANIDVLLRYAAIDALTTRMVLISQQADLGKERTKIASVEATLHTKLPTRACEEVMYDNTIPLCRIIAGMEYNGVHIDRDKCAEYKTIIEEKIKEAEDVIFTDVGYSFNTSSSSPDLARIIFEEKGLPVKKRTDTGVPSTDADTIKELADEFKLPFLEKLLAFRKLDKCLHTYIENWLKISEYDGNIHAEFDQKGTATYRLSSKSPNLQNVPFQLKEAGLNLKALFLPDSDDYELYELEMLSSLNHVKTVDAPTLCSG